MAFTFRMFTADGDDLPDYVAMRPDWNPGDTLYVNGKPTYRIRAIVPMHDLDNEVYAGIWEVEPVRDLES
jgi:hypothetical protein